MAVRLAAAAQFNEPRHCRDPLFGQIPPNVELLSALETSTDGRLPIADCRTRVSKHEHERTGERTTERATKRTSAHCIALTFALNLLLLSLSLSVQICMRICFWPAVCSTRHCALLWSSFQLAVGQRHRNFWRAATLTATATETATTTRLSLRGSERGSSSSSCNANQKCVQGNNFWKTYITLQTTERRVKRASHRLQRG